MFRNYLLIAFRNIAGQKFYSAVNILGLAIGIACFLLIALWVKDELSYDRHFKNADRIYRVENSLVTEGVPMPMAAAEPRFTEYVRKEHPEIGSIARIVRVPTLLRTGANNVYIEDAFCADTSFFTVFSFEFVAGDKNNAMRRRSVVVDQSTARRLFGDDNALGKKVFINNTKTGADQLECTVTGVIKDQDFPAHFHPRVIIPKFHYLETFELTYVLFNEGYSKDRFIKEVWEPQYNRVYKDEFRAERQDIPLNRLQPLTNIHLSGNIWEDLEDNGDRTTVYIFSALGFVILLIACINYVNLATARSSNRYREVGVRKVLGASRAHIIAQFLTESAALAVIALLLALSFVEMTLPMFNTLAGKHLTLNILHPQVFIGLFVFAIIVGCISGAYPAFFISSFQPIKALKDELNTAKNKPTLRKALVVVQFSLSIIMLASTMVIAKQLRYVKGQDLGFDRERVVVVDMNDQKVKQQREQMKQELLKNSNVVKVASSYNIPGTEINHTYISFERPNGDMEAKLINSMFVDCDFINTMGLTLIEGKGFDRSMLPRLDTEAFMILNESAVKFLGYDNPVGKKVETGVTYGLRKGYCIGVVKDFHAASLHYGIEPLVLTLGTIGRPEGKFSFLLVKVKGSQLAKTIDFIKQTYSRFSLGYPFQYSFLDRLFNDQYDREERQRVLFNWFAGLSICISCMGLIGLASFSTRQRTKEICVRKVSGASVSSIVWLLSMDFIKLVLVSFIIAMPIAYYAMNKWLSGFAYHTSIDWVVFFLPGMISLLIAVCTIGVQSIIAANKDPALLLKYE